jgi:uncharacterized protein (TIGR02145 family)
MKHILTLAALVFATACFGQVPDYVPTDGLVAWYPLDGGGLDGTGLGEEAIIHGGEWVIDRFGLENGAIRLDGVDDYVEIPSSGQINFGDSQSFTVALWWSPDAEVSHGGFNGIVNKSFPSGSSQMQGWQLGSSDDDQWFNLQVTGGTEDSESGMSCGFIETYQEPLLPQLMILEFDRESLMTRFELDGNLLTEVACDALTQSFDNDHPLTLGVEREGIYHSSGRFEDLSLWNRLLSLEEKQALQISGPWLSGCTDEGACNFDSEANVNDGSCLDCSLFEERCGPGTVWDESIQLCIVANPSDTDFDGCVSMTDLLDLLSVFGTCNEIPWACGDPLEYQGYDYETVQIGEQCWFAENLRAENYSNGDPIEHPTLGVALEDVGYSLEFGSDGWWCTEGNQNFNSCDSEVAVQEFGRHYNGFSSHDERGLCPTGWRVPNHADWFELAETSGGQGSAGQELKAAVGWNNATNGTDSFGWNAKPAGTWNQHNTASFQNSGSLAWWWSTSMQIDGLQGYVSIGEGDFVYVGSGISMAVGASIRCIQDPE